MESINQQTRAGENKGREVSAHFGGMAHLTNSFGRLTVGFVSAEFDPDWVDGHPHSYCVAWLLERVRWRRRKGKPRGRGMGESPLRPEWGEAFEFDEVPSDAKLAVDVWSVGVADEADEFLGKVTIRLDDALANPVDAWHKILPGRVQLQLSWQQVGPDGEELGAQVPLSLDEAGSPVRAAVHRLPPPPSDGAARVQGRFPASPPQPPPQPQPHPPPQPSPQRTPQPSPRPRPAVVPAAPPPDAYASDGFEADEADADEGERFALELHEYTHRGGTGTGPKENQDAHFVVRVDEGNYAFGVFDGHGHDNGRAAAWAAADACKAFLVENFDRLRTDPEGAMALCFEVAHGAVLEAILAKPDYYAKHGVPVRASALWHSDGSGSSALARGRRANRRALLGCSSQPSLNLP
jgi:hypothetical protein